MTAGERVLTSRLRDSRRRQVWPVIGPLIAWVLVGVTSIVVGVTAPLWIWFTVRPVNPGLAVQLLTYIALGWLLLGATMVWPGDSRADEAEKDAGEVTPTEPTLQRFASLYDVTAGMIDTPRGPGLFVTFDPTNLVVIVEEEYRYLVEYPAAQCFVIGGDRQLCSMPDGTSP